MPERFKRYINLMDNGDGTMTIVACLEEGQETTILSELNFDDMIKMGWDSPDMMGIATTMAENMTEIPNDLEHVS